MRKRVRQRQARQDVEEIATTVRPAGGQRPSTLLLASVTFGLLCLSSGERTLGTITDEQQILSTATAMAMTGQLGIARGRTFSIPRPAGDALSISGIGQALLEAPLALLSEPWERTFGARSSQSLFVLLSISLVTAAAVGSSVLAATLGAPPAGRVMACLGTAFASPLGAYASTSLTEPLQAAALSVGLAAAALAVREDRGVRRVVLVLVAGFCSGWAVLAKSINLILLPLTILPLVLDGASDRSLRARARLLLGWTAGALAPLAAWLVFDMVRFGRPLGSYSGQGFTHPFLDGLWRLLVGPNKGLVWYFPLFALAIVGAVVSLRRPGTLGTGGAAIGIFAVLLLTSSPWWAWDGTVGWGPRLLVPALPLLAALAGAAMQDAPRGRRLAGAGLLAAGVIVNLLGVLQVDAATQAYVETAGPVRIPESEADRYPDELRNRPGEARLLIARSLVASLDSSFSPLRLHAFILETKLRSPDRESARRRLETEAPWLARWPDARPLLASSPGGYEEVLTNELTTFRWPHLFSVLSADAGERRAGFIGAWDIALTEQVRRALDTQEVGLAASLARRLWRVAPSGLSAAFLAEALRVAGKPQELHEFLETLPADIAASPLIDLVRALLARDRGDARLAYETLNRAARAVRTASVQRALREPLPRWPAGLQAFLR